MHSTKLSFLVPLSAALFWVSTQSMAQPASDSTDHNDHAKEHGEQIYQSTQLDVKWQHRGHGAGELQSSLETWIGGDLNKLYLEGHFDKAESDDAKYDLSAMYSRNIAEFWDVQGGIRYRHEPNQSADKDSYEAVLGLHGLARYYFETKANLYAGSEQRYSLSLEMDRDLLLTQKLILQPHLSVDLVLSDDSKYAQKTGVNKVEAGIETRYEISKKVMPFLDVAYEHHAGRSETDWQHASSSENTWLYAAGIRFKF